MTKSAFTRAFTLVELLVVITIVAVLIALLMPALATAKDRSKGVVCMNQQKQLGLGFSSYLGDNNGFYPYITPGGWLITTPYAGMGDNDYTNLSEACANGPGGSAYNISAMGWNAQLDPYFNCPLNITAWRMCGNFCNNGLCGGYCSAQVYNLVTAFVQNHLTCPSNPWQLLLWNDVGNPTWCPGWCQCGGGANYRLLPTTYAMNGTFFPSTFAGNYDVCTNTSGWVKRTNLADVTHPSGVALLGEMPWEVVTNPSPPNVWRANYLPGSFWMTAGGVTNATIGAMGVWQHPTPYTYCNGYVAAWHGQCMNTLFPDGHVDRINQGALATFSVQYTANQTNNSPGSIFWGDGKLSTWNQNQFPGYNFPY